ncbi:MAG TPA: hypothetical protein GXX41_04405 [Thermoanaerobacterium sp.]|nr:hypothetical protein [Thermoanaerobacterium sp.]
MTDVEIIQKLETCWDRTEEALLLDEIKNRKPNIFSKYYNTITWQTNVASLIVELKREVTK